MRVGLNEARHARSTPDLRLRAAGANELDTTLFVCLAVYERRRVAARLLPDESTEPPEFSIFWYTIELFQDRPDDPALEMMSVRSIRSNPFRQPGGDAP